MRALRPGSHTLVMLQAALMSFVSRTACDELPFWRMLTERTDSLESRALAVVSASGRGRVVASEALVGAGSAPGTTIESRAVEIAGDATAQLRRAALPVVARVVGDFTLLDMRTVAPEDDAAVIAALRSLA
jgi:L-seryl-tRNA(Ser) seleniumtransferase